MHDMGTQTGGVITPDPSLTNLSDTELAVVYGDRVALCQALVDAAEYEAADLLRNAIANVYREVERRMAVVIEQGKALRAFIDNDGLGPAAKTARGWSDIRHLFDQRVAANTVATASPEEAAQWKDADDQFRL